MQMSIKLKFVLAPSPDINMLPFSSNKITKLISGVSECLVVVNSLRPSVEYMHHCMIALDNGLLFIQHEAIIQTSDDFV